MSHLSDKYGESFEIEDLETTNTHRTKQEYRCHSLSRPDISFIAGKDKNNYYDGYFGVLAKEKCEEIANEVISKNSGEYKVFCRIENQSFDDQYNDISQLFTYLKEDNSFNIHFYIFTVDETKCDIDTIMDELNTVIPQYTIHLNLIIEDQLDKITENNFLSYYKTTEAAYETSVG